jgi:hypothetical protein
LFIPNNAFLGEDSSGSWSGQCGMRMGCIIEERRMRMRRREIGRRIQIMMHQSSIRSHDEE